MPAFSVYTCACRGVALQPVAELVRAGEVDDPHLGAQARVLARPSSCASGGQRDQVRVEAGLGQHLAGDLDGERERQDRAAGAA